MQLGVIAEGLGMKVIYFDVESKLPLGNAQPKATLSSLLEDAHVRLHVPKHASTELLMGSGEIAKLRQGVMLINASRGNVVDLDALADALRSGRIGGAAIDVFPVEPRSNNDEFLSPLRGLDQSIQTPHIGGSTAEAQENICLLYTSPSPRDTRRSRMPSSA